VIIDARHIHPAMARISNACDMLSSHAIIPPRHTLGMHKRIDSFEISVANNIHMSINKITRDYKMRTFRKEICKIQKGYLSFLIFYFFLHIYINIFVAFKLFYYFSNGIILLHYLIISIASYHTKLYIICWAWMMSKRYFGSGFCHLRHPIVFPEEIELVQQFFSF